MEQLITLSESMIVGVSFTDWFGNIVNEFSALINTLLVVIGVVVAVITIAKNPTVGRSIMGIVVGAFIASLPWLVPAVGGMFQGDIESSGSRTVVEAEDLNTGLKG
ncbi:hypothetical protein ACT3TB_16260 [Micrococcaceae sp. AOP34-BR2-30]